MSGKSNSSGTPVTGVTLSQFAPDKEPNCVVKAREIPSVDALKLIISWAKRRNVPEDQRGHIIKTFQQIHNIELGVDEVLEVLSIPPFSCNISRELGFCGGLGCSSIPPAERLILSTSSVILFSRTAELDLKIGDIRRRIPLKKLFRPSKDGSSPNVALFESLFIEAFTIPPNPPLTAEDCAKIYAAWLEMARRVDSPVDPDSLLEEAVIDAVTSLEFYRFDLLKEVKSRHFLANKAFVDDSGVIYVASYALQLKLEEMGVSTDLGKVGKAVQHLLAGSVKRMRVAGYIVRFWRFNAEAIAALLERQGVEWKPEPRESFPDDFGEELRREIEGVEDYGQDY